jgi:uncharacterized protein (DUF1697 family)
MITYVAFLRGINVGGYKSIKMEQLKMAFESSGFQNVKTFIASGNVIFDSEKTDSNRLAEKIKNKLKSLFGYEIGVILRTIDELQKMMDSNPFKGIKESSNIKFYVSFLGEKSKHKIKVPYESAQKDIIIVKVTDGELFSVCFPRSNGRFGNPIALVEKEFGKKSTTRNWNTINRMIQLKDP